MMTLMMIMIVIMIMMDKVARSKSKSETDSVRSVALSLKHPYKRAASAPGVMCNVGKHSALGTKTSGGGAQSLFSIYYERSLLYLYFSLICPYFCVGGGGAAKDERSYKRQQSVPLIKCRQSKGGHGGGTGAVVDR